MASKLTLGDLQVVTRIPMFRGLRPETVEHIVRCATALMLSPRECLVMQDDPATAFFIVIDGWVKLFRNAASGGETGWKHTYLPVRPSPSLQPPTSDVMSDPA